MIPRAFDIGNMPSLYYLSVYLEYTITFLTNLEACQGQWQPWLVLYSAALISRGLEVSAMSLQSPVPFRRRYCPAEDLPILPLLLCPAPPSMSEILLKAPPIFRRIRGVAR